jgi:hypothetical protein
MSAEGADPTVALAAREIVSTGVVGAPRERVFKALTDPDPPGAGGGQGALRTRFASSTCGRESPGASSCTAPMVSTIRTKACLSTS